MRRWTAVAGLAGLAAALAGCEPRVATPRIDSLTPAAVCVAAQAPERVTVRGAGFTPVPEALLESPRVGLPAATLRRTSDLAGAPVGDAATPVAVTWLATDRIEVTLGGAAGLRGLYRLEVTGADGQVAAAEDALALVDPPAVTQLSPQSLCRGDQAVELVIEGSGLVFGPGDQAPSVQLGELVLTAHDPEGCRAIGGAAAGVRLCERARVTVDAGALPEGVDQPMSLANPGEHGCAVDSGLVVRAAGARAIVLDPPVVWSGAAFEVVVHLDAPAAAVASVSLQPAGQPGARMPLQAQAVPGRQTQLSLAIPEGLAGGDWDLIIDDGDGCQALLPAALQVSDETQLALTATDPDVLFNGVEQRLEVRSGGGGLQPTPWLFLRAAGGGGTALRLRAEELENERLASATVPAGVPAGAYDVILIEPDGRVGVLAAGVQLSAAPPPAVDDVQPRSFAPGANRPFRVSGDRFADPSVTLRCRKDGDGDTTGIAATVTAWTASSIDATATVPDDQVCLVRVRNGDGAVAFYSAIAVSSPPGPREQSQLRVARRAPAAAIAVADGVGYLYAIGGDDGGGAAAAMRSVEVAQIEPWGQLKRFMPLGDRLGEARTMAGAASWAGFVYVAGGSGPSGPLATVARARVLEAASAPRPEGVELSLGSGAGSGLGGGQWVYRVSALRGAGDPIDPGGETIASESVTVTLPERDERVRVRVSWSAVAGAAGYRVYRTAAAGEAAGQVLLLAEVGGGESSYVDAGGASDGGMAPVPPGALGAFSVVATLGAAREGATALVAPDPTDATRAHLFVIGGRNAAGQALDSFERVTLDASGQVVGAPVTGGGIGGAKWLAAAWLVDGGDVPAAAPDSWIYVGGGAGQGSGTVSTTVVGRVQAGGTLVLDTTVTSAPNPRLPGAAALLVRGLLVLAGGGSLNGGSSGVHSAQICDAGGGGCGGGFPELRNWSASGTGSLLVSRTLAGAARLRVFQYVLGGVGGGGAALNRVEGGAL